MICYFDTSALVKKYVLEKGSAEVQRYWSESRINATSAVTYAETAAAFQRKLRESAVALHAIEAASRKFQTDWNELLRVAVSDQINGRIDALVARYPLRGFDAIHLASALFLRESFDDLVFVCSDERLVNAARGEGLFVLPKVER